MQRPSRRCRAWSILPQCASIVLAATLCQLATARTQRDIDIVSLPAPDAIREFVLQTDLQVLFNPASVGDHPTQPVRGMLEPLSALAQMLSGTGLTFNMVNDRTAVIGFAQDLQHQQYQGPDGRLPEKMRRYAKNDASAVEREEVRPAKQAPSSGSKGNEARSSLETVTITGSNIRGATQNTSPLRTFDRTDIERTGSSTVGQFARVLPENFSSVDATTYGRTSSSISGGFNQAGNNVAFGSTFNLRGMGPGATLVLMNGRRLSGAGTDGAFVDVSMIPLSIVDRIDVLTDGASAVYGADAIAGVVNINTRRDFRGFESGMRYGASTRGDSRDFTVSQLAGTSWDKGNALLVYEHGKQEGLWSDERRFASQQILPYSLSPEEKRDSVFISGSQSIGATEFSADGFFSDRNPVNIDSGTFLDAPLVSRYELTARQYGGALSLKRRLFLDWVGELDGGYSRTRQSYDLMYLPENEELFPETAVFSTDLTHGALRADGALFSNGPVSGRAALGIERRRETLMSEVIGADNRTEYDRNVTSAYVELLLSISGSADRFWRNAIQLSLAGRFDDYEDVGSSTNPKVGLRWEPIRGLALRGTFSKSFRAPSLPQLNPQASYFTRNISNPVSGGTTDTLYISGAGNSELNPERSRSYSAGFEIEPPRIPALRITATYFNSHFTGRIAGPPLEGGIFAIYSAANAANVGPFLTIDPDLEDVAAIFAANRVNDFARRGVAGVEAIFRSNPINIARTDESGIDLGVSYQLASSNDATYLFGVEGTHLFRLDYQALPTTGVVSFINKIGTPVDLKMRAHVSVTRGNYDATIAVNHVPSYRNNLSVPVSSISSWTTADFYASYNAESIGIRFAAALRNVTDKDPPFVSFPTSLLGQAYGYDAPNASPFGRTFSLQLNKSW